ncbi:hypothetical protein LXL04_005392 [Taraxacum kok-saghyz]
MALFNHHSYDIESQELGNFGKLPRLRHEDDPGNKLSKETHRLPFSIDYHQQPPKSFHNLDDLFLDTSHPFRSYQHQMQELANIESQYSELIKPHTNHDVVRHEVKSRKLSTDQVIRLGGEKFIQSCSSSSINNISMPSHPYRSSFLSFSNQEAKDVELVQNLLLSAEKVSQKQFERAIKLLNWCDLLSSNSGNPIQRLVYYFSKALRDKIGNETGRILIHGPGKKHLDDMEGRLLTPNPTSISVYQKLPFFQAGEFSGVQALVDAVMGSSKVHVIDLSIKHGVQCTILMQALVSQPNCKIHHLKVTVVGTNFKEKIDQTGQRLTSFAESLNLSFSFNVVMVEDMLEFKQDLLDLDQEESLAVYSSSGLWRMIGKQDRLESLMKVIKSINPRVMVVSEAAVNLNSSKFVNRFIEALFYYGAFFDALEDCMDPEDEHRYTDMLYFIIPEITSILLIRWKFQINMLPSDNIEHIDNDNINVPHQIIDLLCSFNFSYISYTNNTKNLNEMSLFNQHSYDVESQESGNFGKLPQLSHEDDTGNKLSKETHQLQKQSQKAFHNLDALFLDTSPPFRSYQHQMQELANIESQYSELIKPHTNPKTTNKPNHDVLSLEVNTRKLSTDQVIRLGGEKFIQSCSSSSRNDISMPSHPYRSSFVNFSNQEDKDVELVQNLLLSAEKVSQKQFERAIKLLNWCDTLSLSFGNPIQRLVYYFSKALREKIGNETGRISIHGPGTGKKHLDDIEGRLLTPNPTWVSVYEKLPFFQAAQFSGVQALVDAVMGASKVHSFAESINLSFSFNVVMVEDMLDFKKYHLDLDREESLAVYSSYGLWRMIGKQDRLESLMKVIKSINPRVMVVSEAAVNLNSLKFVNRFIEALFYFGAFFDALEDCMDRDDENRTITESVYMGNGIYNIVATEGLERAVRNVDVYVWRQFFSRFGMKEIELSMSSLYQANLVAENFACGSSCTRPHHQVLEGPVEAPTSSNSAVANPATDSSSVSTGLDTPPDP